MSAVTQMFNVTFFTVSYCTVYSIYTVFLLMLQFRHEHKLSKTQVYIYFKKNVIFLV